ncbi:hypothetical protein [Candidatus Nanohalococcus occultus]|uniref:Uncharacterized protein n=1 Tax=Candidatus Nanohalococcus occultus TaxID=2978047 RepID=A0ABY8CEA7_9ARCH|nr:hypothetical protein SVXNc_0531 [Candidatus Nanohaloarchaeota archaeon SVXNc]
MTKQGPENSDAAQTMNTKTAERMDRAMRNSQDSEGPVPTYEGQEVSKGHIADAVSNLGKTESRNISYDDITPSSTEVLFPRKRDRLLDEFFGAIIEAEGLENIEDAENKEQLEELGLLQEKDDGYEATPLSEKRIPGVLEHEGGKYDWITANDRRVNDVVDTVISDVEDGRRIEALRFMDLKQSDPEAIEDLTGADMRELTHELDQYNCLEFTKTGVTTTSRGQTLKHFLDESYEVMASVAKDRASSYQKVKQEISKHSDHPVLEPDSVNISGHRELIESYME